MAGRDRQLMTNLEEEIYSLTMDYCGRTQRSASSYIRGLIIKDLMEKDLLTPELQAKLIVGE